jgi:acyl carrier protein
VSIDDRIKAVMSNVFGIPVDHIDDQASPDTLEAWDSLNAMNLSVSLEEEFNVMFTSEELSEMSNFKLIRLVLLEKGVEG